MGLERPHRIDGKPADAKADVTPAIFSCESSKIAGVTRRVFRGRATTLFLDTAAVF